MHYVVHNLAVLPNRVSAFALTSSRDTSSLDGLEYMRELSIKRHHDRNEPRIWLDIGHLKDGRAKDEPPLRDYVRRGTRNEHSVDASQLRAFWISDVDFKIVASECFVQFRNRCFGGVGGT